MAEPEKIKEFNKALTKAELAASENQAKKREQYVLNLEEKYDEILKDYMKKERPQKNCKRENIDIAGFYKTKKEMDREMGKNRRDILSKVANIYKQE